MKSVHEGKDRNCDQGQNQSTAEDKSKKHIQGTHGGSEPSASMNQNQNQNQQKGKESVEGFQSKKYVLKRIKCEICEKRFNKSETFKKHMRQVHGSVSQNEVTLQKMLRRTRTNKKESNALVSIN